MFCGYCGAAYDAGARFCAGCGARAQARPAVLPSAAGRGRANGTVPRDELAAAVAAREELGARMEPDVIDAFLDRVGHAIDARVDARLRGQTMTPQPREGGDSASIAVGISSLIFGIPLTAIAAAANGLVGMLGVWTMISVINVAVARRHRD
jgi:hypothetical protein